MKILSRLRFNFVPVQFMLVLLILAALCGAMSKPARAEFEPSFLYSLANFSGRVPFNWANVHVDEQRKEIYVADTRLGDIRIFNQKGMQVYQFGDDLSYGNIIDVAVDDEGRILVLASMQMNPSILVCNFKGDLVSILNLQNMPAEFSDFKPSSIVFKHGQLYLLDKYTLRLAVMEPNGLFKKGYDIGSLLNIDEKKRGANQITGFSVDHRGNMLFTIAVLFRAFRLTPEGEVSSFGRPGSAPGRFNITGGIVADDHGYYYVADRLKSAIIVFDQHFKFVSEFGYRGRKPRNLIGPRGLELDTEGNLYVSQLRDKGISVFKITYK